MAEMSQGEAVDALVAAGMPRRQAKDLVDCLTGLRAALATFGPTLGKRAVRSEVRRWLSSKPY